METPAIYKGAKALTTKSLFSQENVRKKFEELLGKRAPQFIASVLQITASNDLLAKADPHSVLNAAAMAATLDLPLNASLGFAYIIPYNDRKAGKCLAQFQIGYKGFIQLAQRSGQFKTIASTPIYEGQIVEMNPLTGFKFDFALKTSDKVVGYAAFFSLVTGFEKTFYMSVDDVKKHAGKYSQSFKNGYGVWKDNFDEMACKTVTKLLLANAISIFVTLAGCFCCVHVVCFYWFVFCLIFSKFWQCCVHIPFNGKLNIFRLGYFQIAGFVFQHLFFVGKIPE